MQAESKKGKGKSKKAKVESPIGAREKPEPKRSRVTGAAIVVGGGIGGVQASLDLVEMGYKVYLLESSPSLGGVMGQLDKTFPTNDCSMCILSPKLVEAGSSENIEILTLTDVLSITGKPGDFKARVRIRPRYVDVEKCTGCGICSENCRVKVKDPYNANLTRVPLIRVPFPQAVPLSAFIDPSKCLFLLKGKCGNCKEVCAAGAVNFNDKERIEEIRAGSVIIASGLKTFDARKRGEYGYGIYPNVITSLEFERILCASGPTQGRVIRRNDGKHVKKIGFIQCVGSRDKVIGNSYCSSVCCMYSTKEAIIAKEHSPEIEPTIFYIDTRACSKGFEEYTERAKEFHGIRYIRCLPSFAKEVAPSGNILLRYIDEGANIKEEEFDLLVLSVGLEAGTGEIAKSTGVELDQHGFVSSPPENPVSTSRPGIYACGVALSPKDIPETVAQASASAGMASLVMKEARGKLMKRKEYPPEREISPEPRIGVVVCHCGTNIGGVVNVKEVVEFAKDLPGVVFSDERIYACSQDAQEWIRDMIGKHDLNRVVVASCTPRTHQPLFRETLKSAGLNKYLFEMANIREHCSWVHMNSPEEATEKAKTLVRMAVAKASLLVPLAEGSSPVVHSALVIGGGVAGMVAALKLAETGYQVYLLEGQDSLGGKARHVRKTIEGMDVSEFIEKTITRVMSHPRIEIFLGARLKEIDGYIGSFRSTIEVGERVEEIEHGVVIVATGAEEYVPRKGEYLFGLDERVITQTEFERRIWCEPETLRNVRRVAMIQCVGSRSEEHPYCSRICCSVAVKNSLAFLELNPDADVSICYKDVRTYGLKEDYYFEAREKGVNFIRFNEEYPPSVGKIGEKIELKVNDANLSAPSHKYRLHSIADPSTQERSAPSEYNRSTRWSRALQERRLDALGTIPHLWNGTLSAEEIKLEPDLVVLSCGTVANPSAQEIAQMLKVPLDSNGFFLEAHVKLKPVDFATDGIFVAGLAHYPKTISESIDQANAAASRAETILSKEEVITEGTVAFIDEEICTGCGQCVSLCSFGAITFDEEKRVAVVNPSLCKGCGTCSSACYSGASRMLGFTPEQLYSQIEAAFLSV
ncbi:MAG: CoB--CoM heterodisulfide reductase iron-sulfur subunit A family protein [Actinomycetota bacterium]|nr:CoB--CoM heterodisulfide reductase iron-sulfur subunit A family protein [Actinomycetota bacterium]